MSRRSDPLLRISSLIGTGRLARASIALAALTPGIILAAGDSTQGAQLFRHCMACHSAAPGVNMTGPSLAGIFGRKAGSLKTFHRYSDALRNSQIVWDEQTLDAWLRSSTELVPGSEMRFAGIPDETVRRNLIAYLRDVSEGKIPVTTLQRGELPNLKEANPEVRVSRIRYCDDTYAVTTAVGRTFKFWEFNLRFKTDSSPNGPSRNEPVLVSQGMQGDRAQVVFSNPGEIVKFIKRECGK